MFAMPVQIAQDCSAVWINSDSSVSRLLGNALHDVDTAHVYVSMAPLCQRAQRT